MALKGKVDINYRKCPDEVEENVTQNLAYWCELEVGKLCCVNVSGGHSCWSANE